MGTKYPSQAVTGYNSLPPPDNGAQSAANKISWATIKTKLPDPILALAQAINTALLTALDISNTSQIAAYTTLSSDHLKPIEVSMGAGVHLASAASVGAGYQVTVVNTDISLSSTVDLANSANTLDGSVAGSATLAAGQSITVAVNASVDGYYTINRGWGRGGLIVSEPVRFDSTSLTFGSDTTVSSFNGRVTLGDNNATGKAFTVSSAAADYAALIQSAHGSTPFGLQINFPNAAPNGTANPFWYCNDSATVRAQLYDNGGLANYSANNVNLSDAAVKADIEPLSSAKEQACDDMVKALEYKTFRYIDGDRELIGLIAQDVKAIDPSLVTEFSPGKLGYYSEQLQQRINASLLRRVAELEAMVAELKK